VVWGAVVCGGEGRCVVGSGGVVRGSGVWCGGVVVCGGGMS